MRLIYSALFLTTFSNHLAADTQPISEDQLQIFKKSLTFYASFDKGFDADFALGDKRIHSIRKKDIVVGTGNASQVSLAPNEGCNDGGALEFKSKKNGYVFFQGKENLVYKDKNWSGTFSFWLKADPVSGLAPGYTDPVQLTDANYKDSAIWVDFTKSNPRQFRFALISDLDSAKKKEKKKPKRVSAAKTLPFSGDVWTHVVITYSALNTDKGQGRLYFDGVEQASVTDIDDPFTWDLSKAKIQLGLSYVGMIDEISAFSQAFTADQVQDLHSLDMKKLISK